MAYGATEESRRLLLGRGLAGQIKLMWDGTLFEKSDLIKRDLCPEPPPPEGAWTGGHMERRHASAVEGAGTKSRRAT